MLSISLKNLWSYKRRLAGTLLAVVLGVAFLSGTLVLGDTLRANFDSLFSSAVGETDALVRNATKIASDQGGPDAQLGLIEESLAERVRAVDGVAAAAPVVEGYGRLIGADGKAIGGNGPPTLAGNWVEDPDLNPFRIAEGRPPRGIDEVVVNRGAARAGGLRVGDRVTVETPQRVQVEIVGLSTFGSADGLGGTTFTAFTLEGVQRHVTGTPGQVTSLSVEAAPGVSQDELVRRLRPVLPRGVEAISGARLLEESLSDINRDFLDLLRALLLVFAGIALLVATFSIANTFSILVAQRTRESALLRAVGASRGQVLGAVLVEALAVGLVASAAGVLGGLGVAGLLKGVFDSFGFALPAGGLAFTATSVVLSVGVGLAVTLLAAMVPAVRASRVPPLAALRDVATGRTSTSPRRTVGGVALTAVGVAALAVAVLAGGDGVLLRAGLGALATLAGVVVLGPTVARRASAIIGSPLPRLRGVTGSLARGNAMRSPRRTAGSATALMVGVGVVTLFTVFTASLKASIDQSMARSFRGDLVISAGRFGGGGMSPRLATEIGRLPEVRSATGLGAGAALLDGDGQPLSIGAPARLVELLGLRATAGSLERLDRRQLAVSEAVAGDRGWRLGEDVAVTFADGQTSRLEVGAIYADHDIVADHLLTRAAWAPHGVQDIDTGVYIRLRDGVDLEAGKAAVQRVAGRYGGPPVQDREEYVEAATQGVDQLLGLVYVMLALAILIAVAGIANTLSLSVHERARELGLLRAVGQTRGQLRAMVRWESVIVAVFGTIGGLGLGVLFGWALVRTASQVGAFSVPLGQLAVVPVAGAVVGVLAGLRPARRAARIGVLEAIASE